MSIRYDSTRQVLLGLYTFCTRQRIIGERVDAILSSCRSNSVEGYEPFAGDSPCVLPIGGDDV